MVVIPDTDIFLLKCPIQIDNKNQLTFSNATSQETYFQSLTKLEIEDASYLRKDGVLRFDGNFEDIIEYNYCMYKNSNYSNKWFYAFITGMEYRNDHCVYIYLKTDVFQSWQFDIIYRQSYIEREMINTGDDVPGANLLPENIETGEYKIQGTAELESLAPAYIFAYSKETINVAGSDISLLGSGHKNINGIPIACYYLIAFTIEGFSTLATNIFDLQNNQSDYVVACFTVPYCAVKDNIEIKGTGWGVLAGKSSATIQNLISTPTSLDGYTPRNKKLLQYPFLYVGFNPPSGSEKIYRYEDFANGTPSFKIVSEVNPNPTVCFIPQNYRGKSGDNLSDMATLNGFPQIATKIDVYNSWLAQNSGIINVETREKYANAQLDVIGNTVGLFTNLGNMLGSAASGKVGQTVGGVGGLTESAISLEKTAMNYDFYIEKINAQKERQAMLPDQVNLGSSNATLLGYELMNNNIFTRYGLKYQFAERIDQFFDMFGYQTNKLKTPNINNRPNWNYIKTAGINLIGDIPESDLQEIKSLFNEGVTLWHNPATFLDYSQNNR